MFTAIKYFLLCLIPAGCTNIIYNHPPPAKIKLGMIILDLNIYFHFHCEVFSPVFLPACQGIFVSTCNVDVRWFPFDIQRCELKFGSWTFDGWLLDIQMKEADVSGYMRNGEWDLLGKMRCQGPCMTHCVA